MGTLFSALAALFTGIPALLSALTRRRARKAAEDSVTLKDLKEEMSAYHKANEIDRRPELRGDDLLDGL